MTGADGFVGRALSASLHKSGNSVIAAVRGSQAVTTPGVRNVQIADICTANWERLLEGVDAVVHLAARAHVVRERNSNALEEFRAVNVQPTIDLFRACQVTAVKRFVFVSSIGVNGKLTTGTPFTETDLANPTEPYAISKWEAEESLRVQFVRDSTSLVIVRPALIYGRNAKGNFLRLMRWIDAGWPLPFGAADARRSFLALTSICDLLDKCLTTPIETVQLFVAADSHSVSTRELIDALAFAMNIKRKQWRVPKKLLSIAAKAVGRSVEFQRLSTSLEVDSTRATTTLGWSSNVTLGADLHAMAETYLRSKNVT